MILLRLVGDGAFQRAAPHVIFNRRNNLIRSSSIHAVNTVETEAGEFRAGGNSFQGRHAD